MQQCVEYDVQPDVAGETHPEIEVLADPNATDAYRYEF